MDSKLQFQSGKFRQSQVDHNNDKKDFKLYSCDCLSHHVESNHMMRVYLFKRGLGFPLFPDNTHYALI